MDKSVPFPQADDISKIKKIISVSDERFISDPKRMQILLGDTTDRQVRYYLSAAVFLGILTRKKTFTEYGQHLRSLNDFEQDISLCQRIVSDETFGEVYFSEVILGVRLDKEEVISVMKKKLPFTSEVMYRRRAQTIMRWVEWIHSKETIHS